MIDGIFTNAINPMINDGHLLETFLLGFAALMGVLFQFLRGEINKNKAEIKLINGKIEKINLKDADQDMITALIREEIKTGLAVIDLKMEDVKHRLEPINKAIDAMVASKIMN